MHFGQWRWLNSRRFVWELRRHKTQGYGRGLEDRLTQVTLTLTWWKTTTKLQEGKLVTHKDIFFHHKGDKILQQFLWEDVASSSLEIFWMKLIKALNSLLLAGISLRGGWTTWYPAVASHLNYYFILWINADVCRGSVGNKIVKYLS